MYLKTWKHILYYPIRHSHLMRLRYVYIKDRDRAPASFDGERVTIKWECLDCHTFRILILGRLSTMIYWAWWSIWNDMIDVLNRVRLEVGRNAKPCLYRESPLKDVEERAAVKFRQPTPDMEFNVPVQKITKWTKKTSPLSIVHEHLWITSVVKRNALCQTSNKS